MQGRGRRTPRRVEGQAGGPEPPTAAAARHRLAVVAAAVASFLEGEAARASPGSAGTAPAFRIRSVSGPWGDGVYGSGLWGNVPQATEPQATGPWAVSSFRWTKAGRTEALSAGNELEIRRRMGRI